MYRRTFASCCGLILLIGGLASVPRDARGENCADYLTNVISREVGQNSIRIRWNTTWVGGQPAAGVGSVVVHKIGTSDFYHSAWETTPTSSHDVTLYGLDMSTDYECHVSTDYDGDGSGCGSPWVAFRTADPPPPCMFGVGHVAATATSTSITVTWQSVLEGEGRIAWKRTGTLDPWTYSSFTAVGTTFSRTSGTLSAGTPYSWQIQMLCPSTGVITTEASGSITTASGGGGGGKGPNPYQPPTQPSIRRAWTNPASGRATLSFALPARERVRIDVFDLGGRHVVNLADRTYPAGEFQVDWAGQQSLGGRVRAGLYFVRLRAGDTDAGAQVFMLGGR